MKTDLPPREIDALIAEKVMDMHVFEPHHTNNSICTICNHGVGFDGHYMREYLRISGSCPHFSTSITHAMEVVEKIKELGFQISIGDSTNGWICTFFKPGAGMDAYRRSEAPTLATAICLAALEVKGGV